MNDIVTIVADTDVDVWLDDVAGKVRHHLGRAAHELYQAGYWLKQAKDGLTYKEWGEWVDESFPFGVETAKRYVRVNTLLDNYIDQEDIPRLVATKQALYELASINTPEDVRLEMIDRLEQGQRLTLSMVKGAATAAIRAEGQREAVLTSGSEQIERLADDLDLDPEVISMLSALETSKPDVFEEIYASGCVWDATGESIPLEDANGRDVRAYVDHNRFERQAQGLSDIGAVKIVLHGVRPPTNQNVYSAKPLVLRSHHDLAQRQVKQAIRDQLGDNIYPYDRTVDIVYTVYQETAPYRPSEVWIRGYEEGLREAGLIQGDGPFHISGVKVRSRLVKSNHKFVIDIYPREELFS